jgi:hypothetical protein
VCVLIMGRRRRPGFFKKILLLNEKGTAVGESKHTMRKLVTKISSNLHQVVTTI